MRMAAQRCGPLGQTVPRSRSAAAIKNGPISNDHNHNLQKRVKASCNRGDGKHRWPQSRRKRPPKPPTGGWGHGSNRAPSWRKMAYGSESGVICRSKDRQRVYWPSNSHCNTIIYSEIQRMAGNRPSQLATTNNIKITFQYWQKKNTKTTKQSASAYAKASLNHTLCLNNTNYNKDCKSE